MAGLLSSYSGRMMGVMETHVAAAGIHLSKSDHVSSGRLGGLTLAGGNSIEGTHGLCVVVYVHTDSAGEKLR